MLTYIKEIKRQFRDVYNFVPVGGTDNEPIFDSITDGEYPMTINGKVDHVRVKNGEISCGHFVSENTKPVGGYNWLPIEQHQNELESLFEYCINAPEPDFTFWSENIQPKATPPTQLKPLEVSIDWDKLYRDVYEEVKCCIGGYGTTTDEIIQIIKKAF